MSLPNTSVSPHCTSSLLSQITPLVSPDLCTVGNFIRHATRHKISELEFSVLRFGSTRLDTINK
jgi:hypothetical protein